MTAENVDRRSFLKKSVAVSTGAALGLSLEEKILLGQTVAKASAAERQTSGSDLPTGTIGKDSTIRVINKYWNERGGECNQCR